MTVRRRLNPSHAGSPPRAKPHVALVGPCGSGKSTLAPLLRELGYRVSQPAQEHSGVPDMWRRLTRPDVLVYLEADLPTLREHRPKGGMTAEFLAELERRLSHARQHADLRVPMAGESVAQSLARILRHLDRRIAAGEP
jgi:hypothetical protein